MSLSINTNVQSLNTQRALTLHAATHEKGVMQYLDRNQAAGLDHALIELQFSSMNAGALGLADLDLQHSAVSLLHLDQALEFVNQQRVNVGAASNRLDLAASGLQTNAVNLAAAKDRIEGADFAGTAAGLTRAQILQQAASAMLAQANTLPRAVLSLLR